MFPIMPLCKAQLKDIRPEDLLFGGLARSCNTYRGGGGYDQFNKIYNKRYNVCISPKQFVVQLKGCPLRCPYCYVTTEGIEGTAVNITTEDLLYMFKTSGLQVFHLMGGAPALYLDQWKDIAYDVPVFHSDFLLVEQKYRPEDLINIPGLHAVSFKERYLYTKEHIKLMWSNLATLLNCGVNFYITFTGKDEFSKEIKERFGTTILKDSFTIELINYKALAI